MRTRLSRPAARRGFTTMELLVVLVIAGILAGLGAGAFAGLVARQRTKNAASDLYGTLSKARADAILRNTAVTVQPQSGGWANGWRIVDPANAGASLETRNAVAGLTVTGPASVVYGPAGRLRSAAPTFVFTNAADGQGAQCLSVGLSGRPYMAQGAAC